MVKALVYVWKKTYCHDNFDDCKLEFRGGDILVRERVTSKLKIYDDKHGGSLGGLVDKYNDGLLFDLDMIDCYLNRNRIYWKLNMFGSNCGKHWWSKKKKIGNLVGLWGELTELKLV